MKKLLLIALLLAACDTKGAGTVTQTGPIQLGTSSTYMIQFDWTGDASTGSVPITAAGTGSSTTGVAIFAAMQGASVVSVETAPGSPAPTNGYSVAILDKSGADVLGGAAATVSSTVAQSWSPALSAAPLNNTVSLSITGQSVASAKGTVYVFLTKSTTSASAKSPPLCRVIGSQTTGYFLKALNGTNDCSWAATSGSGVTSVTFNGTANQITVSGCTVVTSTGTCTFSIPTNPTLPGTTTGTFSGSLTGNVTGSASLNLLTASNLSDLANAGTARTNLGLTALATTTPASGIATFLTTPTSANLLATMTTKTGTGLAVFNDTPTFISPILGNASATSMAIGTSPPTCTPGTAAADCSAEGTAPSVGPASGVDVCYNDSTQHGTLCSDNNAGYKPRVNGPTSSTSGNIPTYNATNGGSIGTGITPGTGVATALATNVSGTGAICLASGSACAGGSSAFIDHQGPTGNVTMTGSDVVIYTTSIPANTVGAGKCLHIELSYHSTAVATDYKLTFGATSKNIQTAASGNDLLQNYGVKLCNKASVTNAQDLFMGYILYSGSSLFIQNSSVPDTSTFTVDTTTTLNLAFKGNGASGTPQGYFWDVWVDR